MAAPSSIITPLNDDQKRIVHVLEEALKEARAGHFKSIGIIACMTTGYATVMAGTDAADLNMGCDSLKKKIMEAVENPAAIAAAKGNGILRVRQ